MRRILKLTIKAEAGSDFQLELMRSTLQAIADAMYIQFTNSHKKNKVYKELVEEIER